MTRTKCLPLHCLHACQTCAQDHMVVLIILRDGLWEAAAWPHTGTYRCTISESSIVYELLKQQNSTFDRRSCRCECPTNTLSPLIGGVYKAWPGRLQPSFSRSPNRTSPRAYNNIRLLPPPWCILLCINRLLRALFVPFHLCRRRCQPSLSMSAVSLVQWPLGARFTERLPYHSGRWRRSRRLGSEMI